MAHGGTPAAAALTTVFTPIPAYCQTGPSPYYTSICMPTNWNIYWSGKVLYYSPGICPSGYTSAGTPTSGFGPPVEPTETAIVCCPSSYTYDTSYTGISYCLTSTSYTTTFPTISITRSYESSSSSAISTSISTLTYTTTQTTSRSSFAYAIQVRFAESDLSLLATHPLTPGATPTRNHTAPATPPPSGGLTTGAKVGIGVGVSLGVLLLAAGLFFFFLRSAKKAKEARQYETEAKMMSPGQQMYATQPMQPGLQPGTGYNMGPGYAVEMAGGTSPAVSYASAPRQPMDQELQRIQDRRSRLMELERLAQEEDRLRGASQGSSPLGSNPPTQAHPYELSATMSPVQGPVQKSSGNWD